MLYKKRLKETRLEKNIIQEEVATYLNISRSLYGRYEKEYLIMPIEHLIKVSYYYHVSIDYLFQLTEDKNYKANNNKLDKVKAGKRLKDWRKKNYLTQEKLANILNTTQAVIATPFLYTICKKYKISADYLLGIIDMIPIEEKSYTLA